MPQALKNPCLIHFWSWQISLFSLLALWGNKKWAPSIKMKQIKNCSDKLGLMGCRWSNLNAPATQTPLSHLVLELEKLPRISALAYKNKSSPPSINVLIFNVFASLNLTTREGAVHTLKLPISSKV